MKVVKKAFEEIPEVGKEAEEVPDEEVCADDEGDDEVDDEGTDEVDDEDYEDDYEHDDNEPDFGQLMSNFFVTENGENVAEALMGIKKAIDTHNKIFLKYVNTNKK